VLPVAQLTSALAKATGVKANRLADQLEEAKVQVELDQDEVDNAKQELTHNAAIHLLAVQSFL
jgi:hypothetical protein